MKAIVLNSILSGFRSRKDKSLGFSASTGELNSVEKVALMELEGINVRLLIEPMDYVVEEKIEVKNEASSKTPSERLRAILFVEYRHLKPDQSFAEFYTKTMDAICEERKAMLPKTPF